MSHWPNVWAPWRIEYIRRSDKGSGPACFLCDACEHPDRDGENLVLHRNDAGLIIMNRYPYTNGAVMVAPSRHVGDLADLPRDPRNQLWDLVILAERLMQTTLNPQGINIGVNVGAAAGAGLPGHVHIHVVPRWGGDTNFMHVVGQVRVQPMALQQCYDEMRNVLPKLLGGDGVGGDESGG